MYLKICKFGGTSMAEKSSILKVKDIVRGDLSRRFVVVSAPGKRFSGDIKITDQLYSCFEQKQKTILGVQRVDRDKVNKYGIVTAGRSEGRVHEVISLVEKPNVEEAPSNIAVLGRYVITPEIFTYLETQEPGAGGEIQLTDALMKMCRDHGMYAYEFEGKRYDIGDKLGYLEATVEYALRDPVLSDGFKAYLKKISSKL